MYNIKVSILNFLFFNSLKHIQLNNFLLMTILDWISLIFQMIIINRNHISLQPEEQRISCQPGLSYRNLLKHVSLVIRPLRCYPFHDGVRTMTPEDYCLPPFRIRVWVRVRIRVGAIFLGGNCP